MIVAGDTVIQSGYLVVVLNGKEKTEGVDWKVDK